MIDPRRLGGVRVEVREAMKARSLYMIMSFILGEEFDAPFARLDWVSRDRFDIQWHRHTGAWFCLYRAARSRRP